MKTLALVATIVNAIVVVFIFQNMHQTELRNERKRHATELSELQSETDYFRAMAQALSDRLSEQKQGEQLEKLGAQ